MFHISIDPNKMFGNIQCCLRYREIGAVKQHRNLYSSLESNSAISIKFKICIVFEIKSTFNTILQTYLYK